MDDEHESHDGFDDFWEIAAGLGLGEPEHRAEQHEEARAIVAAGRARRTFVEELRSLAPGDVVTIVTVDAAAVTGRILAVGRDVVSVGEVADPSGAARRRVVRRHDIRLDAVVRMVREPVW
ncbi:MAG TPA: hypothetical protein VIB48_13410 [Acidimicrobiia bacterium]|jgi:hypothetical protein